MKTNEKTDTAMTLSPTISQGNGDDHAVMPGEFAGMYQAGFESGYNRGREAGYRQGFSEGYAAIHQGHAKDAAGATASAAKTVLKVGPRRMLLGMPCVSCRVYLMSEETH